MKTTYLFESKDKKFSYVWHSTICFNCLEGTYGLRVQISTENGKTKCRSICINCMMDDFKRLQRRMGGVEKRIETIKERKKNQW